jgi:general stress protein 26
MADITEIEHALTVLRSFDTCMLVTRTAEGEMHGRPMVVAEMRDDGALTFVTSFASRVVDEIERDGEVLLTFQAKAKFASAVGRGIVTRDPQRVHALWKAAWLAWFPDGPDDPYVAVVDVLPEYVEVWDNSGTRGIKQAFQIAKAAITKEPPAVAPETHEQVRLR